MVLVADPSHALYISGETVPVASFQWDHALVIKWQPLHKIYLVYAQSQTGWQTSESVLQFKRNRIRAQQLMTAYDTHCRNRRVLKKKSLYADTGALDTPLT